MSKASKSGKTAAPPRRDYDRRRRKGAVRRSSGRPIWRQPLLLGVAVMLLGTGGVGGW
jgi:cell division protein FtsQ